MNDQRLTTVLENVGDQLFAPAGSHQLVPLEAKMAAAPDAIIESATRLAADIIAQYQHRVDEAQRKLAAMREIAEGIVANAQRMAEEVKNLDQQHGGIDTGIARVLADHGIEIAAA
ncbi:MAG TPA: hypothetical protein VF748_07545 [Candidatus Acidoferrum sp.]